MPKSLKNLIVALVCATVPAASTIADDSLSSWNGGETKEAIIRFVQSVSREESPDYVEPSERIAVFDNDGTLWAEQPIYFQIAFALDRVKALAPKHPEWKQKQPFKAALEGDLKAVLAGGEHALLELMMTTHAGNTTDEFAQIVKDWLATARHPKTGRPYAEMVYQPMLELLVYLRANGFKTYIVSGGGIEFMRPWAERVYGIPPEQVIGSSIKTQFAVRNDKPVLVRLPEVNFIDDKAGKPVAINQHIGRRPIAAFGNSDGDLQMLQWTEAGEGPRFCLYVHHTDAEREWAYDRDSHIGKLDRGLDEANAKGWTVVDMKRDWKTIHPSEHHYLHKQRQSHVAEWSYTGATGPEHWGDLNPSYVLARTGRQQSPIDLSNTIASSLPKIHFNYKPSRIRLIYNGHTIQENEEPGSFGMAGDKRFELQQFHFHSPSEHTVDGNHFPMEMHLVHKANDGTIAVVAVFIREGEHNTAFDSVWARLPDIEQPARDADTLIDTKEILPNDHSYYLYDGSFTTPPCTEQVKWVVLKEPVSLSKKQIDGFRAILHGNNRPVQPLNRRQVSRSR